MIAFPVSPDNALDAFNHPFAYLPTRAREPIPLRDGSDHFDSRAARWS